MELEPDPDSEKQQIRCDLYLVKLNTLLELENILTSLKNYLR